MQDNVKRAVKKAKLTYLWVTRILMAPNHYPTRPLRKLRLNVFGGFIADQHTVFDLKNNRKSDYLSEFDWYRSRYINAPFDPMLNNKIITAEVLKHHAAVPQVLLIKNKGRLSIPGQAEVDQDLASVVPNVVRGAGSVFLKPIGAGKGIGVHRIDWQRGNYLLDGKPTSRRQLLDLLSEKDAWFLSETIAQHADLEKLHPDTPNTIRIITMRDPDTGRLEIFFAVLRIGTKGTVPVDNGSRGGLVANIDLETGTLTSAKALWRQGEHTHHPDTNAPIEGEAVPMWEEVKELALRLGNTFPYLQFVAWDVLVGQEKPYIIEANTSSGVNIIQMWGAQRNGRLGDFYRAHGVIR